MLFVNAIKNCPDVKMAKMKLPWSSVNILLLFSERLIEYFFDKHKTEGKIEFYNHPLVHTCVSLFILCCYSLSEK